MSWTTHTSSSVTALLDKRHHLVAFTSRIEEFGSPPSSRYSTGSTTEHQERKVLGHGGHCVDLPPFFAGPVGRQTQLQRSIEVNYSKGDVKRAFTGPQNLIAISNKSFLFLARFIDFLNHKKRICFWTGNVYDKPISKCSPPSVGQVFGFGA